MGTSEISWELIPRQDAELQLGFSSSASASVELVLGKTLLERFQNLGLAENLNSINGHALEKENGKVEEEENSSRSLYPLRPYAEDCSFYLRTGTCKFQSQCRFNHPVRRLNQGGKEKSKERERFQEQTERNQQSECKYYLTTGGCKYGKACKYNHPSETTVKAQIMELNFLGLPIRSGEQECPFYMRNGSCKYGHTCRFHHPDPTVVGASDSYASFMHSLPLLPHQMTESNSFLVSSTTHSAPIYPEERVTNEGMHKPMQKADVFRKHQQQSQVEDFPERPDQPQCSYFMKTGDCKFKSSCRYHHPKSRRTEFNACVLSDKGLPLWPGRNICWNYERNGDCKYGSACSFDHPVNYSSSTISVGSTLDPPSIDDSAPWDD